MDWRLLLIINNQKERRAAGCGMGIFQAHTVLTNSPEANLRMTDDR